MLVSHLFTLVAALAAVSAAPAKKRCAPQSSSSVAPAPVTSPSTLGVPQAAPEAAQAEVPPPPGGDGGGSTGAIPGGSTGGSPGGSPGAIPGGSTGGSPGGSTGAIPGTSSGAGAGGAPANSPGSDPSGLGAVGGSEWSTVNDNNVILSFQNDKGNVPQSLEKAPDNSDAIKNVYPAGKSSDYGFMNFYTAGPPNSFDPSSVKEMLFTYKIWFKDDFDWVKGGKLPGMYGGTDKGSAASCSGGDQREDCFSTRLMWRKDGAGEVYDYYPDRNQPICSDPKYNGNGLITKCDDKGMSIARGAFTFDKGKWVEVSHRVKLNDPDQMNGEQELFVNGESKINLSGLQIRKQDNVRFQGVMAQTFFGGKSDEWAPQTDQTVWFKDFEMKGLANF